MQQITRNGQELVQRLARRHGFSEHAVGHMLMALRDGNGVMAQFDHPEFSGSGQWMRGGMLMLSDMFNHSLKARVDALCNELGALLSDDLFMPDPRSDWWPQEFGSPGATGSQDGIRYAYFPGPRRLVVEDAGRTRVYDTLDHQILGISQQHCAPGRGNAANLTFTSQHGVVDLESLPRIAADGRTESAPRKPEDEAAAPAGSGLDTFDATFDAIERLGRLHAEGLLTDQEFADKKTELLKRI